jgi:hypothetical protein
MGTCLLARSSDGSDLGPFLPGAGALAPIALKRAINKLRLGHYSKCAGKRWKRDKDSSKALSTQLRVALLSCASVSPIPESTHQQTSRSALRSFVAELKIHKLTLLFGGTTLVIDVRGNS